jgi:hypothetical protein
MSYLQRFFLTSSLLVLPSLSLLLLLLSSVANAGLGLIHEYGQPSVQGISLDFSTGILYVASQSPKLVLRFKADGTALPSFSASGLTPCGVTFSPYDRLVYVCDCVLPGSVVTFNTNGSVISTFRLTNGNMYAATVGYTVATDAVGDLYRILNTSPRWTIGRFDRVTHNQKASYGTSVMTAITGFRVLASGHLVIVDGGSASLYFLDNTTNTVQTTWYPSSTGDLSIDYTTSDIAIASSSQVTRWVANGASYAGRQVFYNPSGASLDTIAIDAVRDLIYAVDDTTKTIHQFGATNQTLMRNILGSPQISSSATAIVAVPSTSGSYVVADGSSLKYFQSSGALYTTTMLNYTVGGAVIGNSSLVYVTHPYQGVVVLYNGTTPVLGLVGSSALNNPTGIAIDSQGQVYVCDTGNNRVLVWTVGGKVVVVNGSFVQPTAIVIDPSTSYAYVIDASVGVTKLKVTGSSAQYSTFLPLGSALVQPRAVAIDQQGLLYIADNHSEVVVVYGQNGTWLANFTQAQYGWSTVTGMTVGTDGSLAVLDVQNAMVYTAATFSQGPSSSPSSPSSSSFSSTGSSSSRSQCLFDGYDLTSLSLAPLSWSSWDGSNTVFWLQLCVSQLASGAGNCAGQGIACQQSPSGNFYNYYALARSTTVGGSTNTPNVSVITGGVQVELIDTGDTSYGCPRGRSLIVQAMCNTTYTTPVIISVAEFPTCFYTYTVLSAGGCPPSSSSSSSSASSSSSVALYTTSSSTSAAVSSAAVASICANGAIFTDMLLNSSGSLYTYNPCSAVTASFCGMNNGGRAVQFCQYELDYSITHTAAYFIAGNTNTTWSLNSQGQLTSYEANGDTCFQDKLPRSVQVTFACDPSITNIAPRLVSVLDADMNSAASSVTCHFALLVYTHTVCLSGSSYPAQSVRVSFVINIPVSAAANLVLLQSELQTDVAMNLANLLDVDEMALLPYITIVSVEGVAFAAFNRRRLLQNTVQLPIVFVLSSAVDPIINSTAVSAASAFSQAASQGQLTTSVPGASIPKQDVSTTTTSDQGDSSSSSSMSGGAIAGTVIGVLAGVGLIIAGVAYLVLSMRGVEWLKRVSTQPGQVQGQGGMVEVAPLKKTPWGGPENATSLVPAPNPTGAVAPYNAAPAAALYNGEAQNAQYPTAPVAQV